MKRKHFLIVLPALVIAVAVVILLSDRAVRSAGEGRMYGDTASIPFTRTGLLLGTGKYLANGRINPYYAYRVTAAADLLRAQKIKYLVISGDNSRKDYDEPDTMRHDLILAGADSNRLYCDYAGFRTFDSVVRVHKVFGQDSITIISQPFHNERALFLARKQDLYAVAYNAKDVGVRLGRYTRWRERLARVKVFWDYCTGVEPKFLGKKVNLPA